MLSRVCAIGTTAFASGRGIIRPCQVTLHGLGIDPPTSSAVSRSDLRLHLLVECQNPEQADKVRAAAALRPSYFPLKSALPKAKHSF